MVIGLTKKQIAKLREELNYSKRPLFLFDSDADGLSSFLLLYRFIKEGKGIVIKSTPIIDKKFIRLVKEYSPDKVFILDIARVEQEFIDAVNVPIHWIDHHGPFERNKINYYNPLTKENGIGIPTSYLCYQVVEEDMWLAMAGIVGDWHLSPLAKVFSKHYPDLLPAKIKDPSDALFSTPIGKLSQVLFFSLKGAAQEAMKYAKVLTRIKDPYEILDQKSSRGRYIYKKYHKFYKEYNSIFQEALKSVDDSNLILFNYPSTQTAFSAEISNELIYRYPKKIVLVSREHNGIMRCSLRSGKAISVSDILQNSLAGIDGHGGGHPQACGCSVMKEDYDSFVRNFKEQVEIVFKKE